MASLDEKCLSLWMSSLDFALNLSFYVVCYRYVYLLRIRIFRDLNGAQVQASLSSASSGFLAVSVINFSDSFLTLFWRFQTICTRWWFFHHLRFIVVLWFLSFDRLIFCLSCSTSISSFGCSMWRVQCTHTNNHQMCKYLLLELTYSFSCLRIKFCLRFTLELELSVFSLFYARPCMFCSFRCFFGFALLTIHLKSSELCASNNHLNLGQIDIATLFHFISHSLSFVL